MSYTEHIAVSAFIFFWGIVFISEFEYLKKKFRDQKPKNTFKTKILHVLALIGLLCALYGFFIEPYWIDVHHVDIFTDKLKSNSLRIVHISDLHCESRIRNETKAVKIINELNPDIIVFTGDSLNLASALPLFQNTLKNLNATLGKFAVKGNWDTHNQGHLNSLQNTGFTELNGKSFMLSKNNDRITFSGLSSISDINKAPNIFKDLDPDIFNVFLFHRPGLIEEVSSYPVDLYLAGHTHGGQIRLPFYGALVTLTKHGKKYETGKYKIKNSILYINRGLGLEGGSTPRARFLSRPEITVFNIYPQTVTKNTQ
ncbi:MAG: metallophosphoesterase [Candidatus Omnitrophica bacterium]|nr:metallophosphoesterase [Candidatus Omnitrophota bacterium]MBU1997175.1 metallophosphoesterase [Candidatus Omnitrophota bacterium]MBU4334183.1 metallophosphoesterase [Candidatus Omnitrophota bacterium]